MTAFWLAFAAFFFGLTFGLLQVVTEIALVRRERFAGVRSSAYLAAKVAVLLPVLLAVVVAMIAVLGAFDRLPSMGARTWSVLAVTLLLDAAAALALGLLASSLVRDASQATLALPMLCFPAVLFSGGVLPVDDMPFAGRALSATTTNRWGFDAVGRTMGVDQVASGAGPARVALVAFAALFLLLAWATIGARTQRLSR
jgi:ABC-type multidrug transport system permease subunit